MAKVWVHLHPVLVEVPQNVADNLDDAILCSRNVVMNALIQRLEEFVEDGDAGLIETIAKD